jgi:peptidoglycan/xylan/chitin deacetylase (PgdA/CDA1 family)
MLIIEIPNNNIAERTYIINVFYKEFLDIEVKIKTYGGENYIINLNNKKIEVEDHFFNHYKEELSYLNEENLPKNISYSESKFLVEDNIPVIFGNTEVYKKEGNIYCEIDLFASSFFMLTRWEEYISNKKDSHNRFSAFNSIAHKFNFLDRPVVNEYLELLWNMMLFIDGSIIRKNKSFSFLVTHDVDVPEKYNSIKSGLREIVADVVKRVNFLGAYKKLANKIKVHLNYNKDPYDTFNYLMRLSEKNNLKSYFFFMGKGLTRFDNFYDSKSDFIHKLIVKIKEAGHEIGMHPTYNSYNNKEQFKKEKIELETSLKVNLKFGRQHYLRFEVPGTWQIWEDEQMDWDSTLGFADKEGFRCGVCYTYSVFNILTRKHLRLKEKPLIVMEGSFINYQPNIKPTEMKLKIDTLINTVKKYNGEFVFLWHNNSFNTEMWVKYAHLYKNILNENSNNNRS